MAMTRFLSILVSFLLSGVAAVNAPAAPVFVSGQSYRIVCQQFPAGQVSDGASAGRPTPLCYLTSTDNSTASKWIFQEEQEGFYTIRNAKSGQYVTYDGVRDTYRRYVSLTDTPDGYHSLWTVNIQSDGYYSIRNAGQTDHIWDVRVDSYMVGTYSNTGAGNVNQLFAFYDEEGNAVPDLPTVANPLAVVAAGLTIDGHVPAYAASPGIYLCSIPAKHFGGDYTAVVRYEMPEGAGTLTIDGTEVPDGSSYTFVQTGGSRTYVLAARKPDGTVVSCDLTFTSLPVVRIYGSFSDTYSQGHIIVSEPDKGVPETLAMKAKWRGGITNGSDKHKRNYHVKLLDADGEKLDRKFFGLRNDNSWILEACQVDMIRIRNRMFTDLWNDYRTPPYYSDREPKALSGTRGRFVELMLNGEYRGIYCMTENMDRKQMKLKKHDDANNIDHGQLWKSKDWTYAVLMGTSPDGSYQPKNYLSTPNPSSEMWDNYQVKYPDPEDYGNRTDWQTLYDAVDFVCHSSDDDFRQHIAEYIDLPVVIDYYILMETILSTDNHGKNMFFAVYDKQVEGKVTLGVWDMDATAGQRWSDAYYHQAFLGPEQDYAAFIARYEHGDYNLFKRLRDTDAEGFNLRVRQRYRDLRQTFLATESILKRFRTQLAEFKACGADRRETAKWSRDSDVSGRELNFDTELAYLENWITRRMNYLDTRRFDIASLPAGISSVITDSESGDGYVYNLEGRRIGNLSTIDLLPAGIYIVRGRVIRIR